MDVRPMLAQVPTMPAAELSLLGAFGFVCGVVCCIWVVDYARDRRAARRRRRDTAPRTLAHYRTIYERRHKAAQRDR